MTVRALDVDYRHRVVVTIHPREGSEVLPIAVVAYGADGLPMPEIWRRVFRHRRDVEHLYDRTRVTTTAMPRGYGPRFRNR